MTRITPAAVRAALKPGFEIIRNHFGDDDKKCGCPLTVVCGSPEDADDLYHTDLYCRGFVHGVDDVKRDTSAPGDYQLGYTDGLAVRREFWPEDATQ